MKWYISYKRLIQLWHILPGWEMAAVSTAAGRGGDNDVRFFGVIVANPAGSRQPTIGLSRRNTEDGEQESDGESQNDTSHFTLETVPVLNTTI